MIICLTHADGVGGRGGRGGRGGEGGQGGEGGEGGECVELDTGSGRTVKQNV